MICYAGTLSLLKPARGKPASQPTCIATLAGFLFGDNMNNKANITSFKKGHKGLVGENNPMWKGKRAAYGAIHDWVNLHFGKPSVCEHCDTRNAKKYEWANISKSYKRERSDWVRLCTSCHQTYDGSRNKMWITRRKKHA